MDVRLCWLESEQRDCNSIVIRRDRRFNARLTHSPSARELRGVSFHVQMPQHESEDGKLLCCQNDAETDACTENRGMPHEHDLRKKGEKWRTEFSTARGGELLDHLWGCDFDDHCDIYCHHVSCMFRGNSFLHRLKTSRQNTKTRRHSWRSWRRSDVKWHCGTEEIHETMMKRCAEEIHHALRNWIAGIDQGEGGMSR